MAKASLWDIVSGVPKLIITTALHPVLRSVRGPLKYPRTQSELADLVNQIRLHEIRAGYTHRFIRLMFMTVEDRVFCRRYQYGEPSWHGVFLSDRGGQIKLDGVVANINTSVPQDSDAILPALDQTYADALKKIGASFPLAGATEKRAQDSTLEIFFTDGPAPA